MPVDRRTQYADNGDIIVGSYDAALQRTELQHMSLGVCDNRCSPLSNLAPIAYGWAGTEPASRKRCPMCGDSLKRMTHHSWDAPIQLLGVT
jgi:hypothetical protein